MKITLHLVDTGKAERAVRIRAYDFRQDDGRSLFTVRMTPNAARGILYAHVCCTSAISILRMDAASAWGAFVGAVDEIFGTVKYQKPDRVTRTYAGQSASLLLKYPPDGYPNEDRDALIVEVFALTFAKRLCPDADVQLPKASPVPYPDELATAAA